MIVANVVSYIALGFTALAPFQTIVWIGDQTLVDMKTFVCGYEFQYAPTTPCTAVVDYVLGYNTRPKSWLIGDSAASSYGTCLTILAFTPSISLSWHVASPPRISSSSPMNLGVDHSIEEQWLQYKWQVSDHEVDAGAGL